MKNSDSWKEERKTLHILLNFEYPDGHKQREALKGEKQTLIPNYNNNPT